MNDFSLEQWTKLHNMVPHGIKFLEHTFTGPASFRLRLSPVSSGVYAILVPDRSGQAEYQVIYFGECGDFARQVTRTHEHYQDWVEEAGRLENLYVAYFATPFLTEAQRRTMKNSLIEHYHPVCNEKAGKHFSFGALLGIGR
ncbi:MAG: hypothetical protein EPN47_09645 [Acidobacteria bacterium]|nr:MAG: hypothetical protein EPN47_09645 [Acidobacteriota bacterium]